MPPSRERLRDRVASETGLNEDPHATGIRELGSSPDPPLVATRLPTLCALVARGLKANEREAVAAYLFLAPWLIGLFAFTLGPVVVSLVVSFTDYAILTPDQTHFIGWSNYTNAFAQDPLFWHSLRVTIYYSALALPLNLIIGFALAQLLNTNVPGIAFFRSLYYLPAVISGVVVTLLWLWILNPRFGPGQLPAEPHPHRGSWLAVLGRLGDPVVRPDQPMGNRSYNANLSLHAAGHSDASVRGCGYRWSGARPSAAVHYAAAGDAGHLLQHGAWLDR